MVGEWIGVVGDLLLSWLVRDQWQCHLESSTWYRLGWAQLDSLAWGGTLQLGRKNASLQLRTPPCNGFRVVLKRLPSHAKLDIRTERARARKGGYVTDPPSHTAWQPFVRRDARGRVANAGPGHEAAAGMPH